ncbi:MAG: tetratricopeptide repeat protein [Gemmatimonadetes bacterium]|nr:tetratricopeptide repeat protein [Gemmatimonadota bacterium]
MPMVLKFGDYEIDEAALELTRGGEPVPLSPMAVRMLSYFARRSGKLVTRQSLYEALWPDGCVDRERLVNTYVRQIRAALDERAGENRFLKTYPRRGYRFLPETLVVEPKANLRSEALPPHVPGPRAEVRRHGRLRVLTGLSVVLGALALLLGQAGPEPALATRANPGGMAYQMGRELLSHPSPEQRAGSVEYFRTAIAETPQNGAAHAGLAEGLYWSGDVTGAARAAARALELSPEHARAHMVLGSTLLTREWDWTGAERHLREAVARAPDDPDPGVALAYLLVSAGRTEEALHTLERTTALDPTSAAVTGDLGILYGWLGKHERALDLCHRTISIEPTATWGHACAMEAARALGQANEVRSRVRTLIQLADEDPDTVLKGPADVDRDVRSLRQFQLERGRTNHLGRAVALASLGMDSEAVTALHEAVRDREPGVVALGSEPALRGLEGEPGYNALRERVFAKLRVSASGA